MYFASKFEITKSDADDWFDPILDTDTKLFVDPFLIFRDSDKHWRQAHSDLIAHFNRCFKLIAEGHRDPSTIAYKKAVSILIFPEPKEFCLGYTETGVRGAGGSVGFANLIAEAMSAAILRGVKDLRHFEELGVLNEGIGPDRISDLTCNVLRNYFIAYTREVAERHNVPTSQVNMGGASFDETRLAWRSETVDLPINPATGLGVLLVPKRFLRALPVLNADDWWQNYEADQLRNDMNYEVMNRVNKRAIVAAARANPDSVRDWAEAKEDSVVAPYDLEQDPRGVWQWQRAARSYTQSAPLTIAPPDDDEGFIAIIDLVVGKFKHFVEEVGGWRLLRNDGNIDDKPEEASQLLFKGIAQSYCEANNIVLDREVNLGRGPVDFKFSNGFQRRAHLEVKKLHNSKFWNGAKAQLPSYLKSDGCDLGWFVVVQLKEGGASARWTKEGPAVIKQIANDNALRLKAVTVDARPKQSASEL